jgi:hypothetical protein
MSNDLQTQAASELVAAPAVVIMTGKTLSEKRLSVVSQTGHAAVVMLASTMAGAVGKEARSVALNHVAGMLAKNALSGNYKPVAEALALRLGASVCFGSPSEAPKGETASQLAARTREDWEGFGRDMRRELQRLPEATKAGKVPPARQRAMDALELYVSVRGAIEFILAERKARADAAQKSE